jgi:hypothetical protein
MYVGWIDFFFLFEKGTEATACHAQEGRLVRIISLGYYVGAAEKSGVSEGAAPIQEKEVPRFWLAGRS